MKCGWCGSENLTCEFVDIGVGQQQVTPYECISCGATEMSPDHFGNPDHEIDAEDKRRGWYAGPDSHADATPWPPPMRIIVPGQTLYARDFWYGQRVAVRWQNSVHIAYKTKKDRNDVFETLCGIACSTAATPREPHTTCLWCVCLEGAW